MFNFSSHHTTDTDNRLQVIKHANLSQDLWPKCSQYKDNP